MEALIKPTLALIRADVGLKGKGRLRGRQKCIQADARWRQTYSLHAGCRNPFGLGPLRAAQAALETGEGASNWNGHRAQLPLLQHASGQLTGFLTDCLPWHCILISRHRWRRDLRGAVGGGRAARLQPPGVAFYARVL